jgi:hypothetical protein
MAKEADSVETGAVADSVETGAVADSVETELSTSKADRHMNCPL